MLVGLGLVAAAGCATVSPTSNELLGNSEVTPPTSAPADPALRFVTTGGIQFGASVQGQPIRLYGWVRDPSGAAAIPLSDITLSAASRYRQRVLIFGGIHGNETTTVYAAAKLIEQFGTDAAEAIPPDTAFFLIPVANPDGYAARKRSNSNGVDLNRNFPARNWKPGSRGSNFPGTAPLTEPESKALHSLVLRLRPTRILSLHSIRTRRHGNNYDGPARPLAELLAKHNHYDVLPSIGYPTPGSFGSWAGTDLQIPTITLEFRGTDSNEKAWAENRDALFAFIRGR